MNDGDSDDRRHRRLRAGAVAAAAAALVFIYVAARGDGDGDAAVSSAPAIAVRADASGAETMPSPLQAAASASVVDPHGEPGPGEIDVCGVGRVPLERAAELEAEYAERAQAAVTGLVASLRADGDERRHAAGLFLQRAADMQAATEPARLASERCGADDACREDAGQSQIAAMARAAEAGTEAVAKLATTSHDPVVYALAMQACGSIGVTAVLAPSCRLLSPEQWARVDPGNVVPWLHVAEAAARRKDTAAVGEAIYRASTATSSTLHANTLYGFAAGHLPASASAFEQAWLVMFVAGAGAGAGGVPPYLTMSRYCEAPALQDSNRWQACEALARNFVERPSSLIERRIGERVGERARWPADKIAALRQEDEAMAQIKSGFGNEPQPWACGPVKRFRDHALQVSQLGEFGAARAAMLASGLSVAELVAQSRADRAAVEAATSASGPNSAASPLSR